MASKLDELMALARECGNIERRHCIGKAQGFDVRNAYATLQSALKAVLDDAERYRWLRDNTKEAPLRPHAYNAEMFPDTRLKHSMPDLVSYDCIGQQITLDDAIDAARKP